MSSLPFEILFNKKNFDTSHFKIQRSNTKSNANILLAHTEASSSQRASCQMKVYQEVMQLKCPSKSFMHIFTQQLYLQTISLEWAISKLCTTPQQETLQNSTHIYRGRKCILKVVLTPIQQPTLVVEKKQQLCKCFHLLLISTVCYSVPTLQQHKLSLKQCLHWHLASAYTDPQKETHCLFQHIYKHVQGRKGRVQQLGGASAYYPLLNSFKYSHTRANCTCEGSFHLPSLSS